MQVEPTSRLILGIDEHRHRRNLVAQAPPQGVEEEQATVALVPMPRVHRKPADKGRRQRRVPRQTLYGRRRQFGWPHGGVGQGIVADYSRHGRKNQNERRGNTPTRVLASLDVEIPIQGHASRLKRRAIVVLG